MAAPTATGAVLGGSTGARTEALTRTFARLVYAYKLDPRALVTTPLWALQVLVDELPGIEAAEQLARVNAATMPHAKAADARRYQRDLARLAYPPEPVPPMPKERIDPQAAAEWFKAQGIIVKTG